MPGWRFLVSDKRSTDNIAALLKGTRPTETRPASELPAAAASAWACSICLRMILGMSIHSVSGISHADALLAADQQFLAEIVLQRRKLLAERRLGEMQDAEATRVMLPPSTMTMKDLRRLYPFAKVR